MSISALQKARYNYKPKLPAILSGDIEDITVDLGKTAEAASDREKIRAIFKNTYGKPLASFVKGKNDNKTRVKSRRNPFRRTSPRRTQCNRRFI